MGTGYIRNDTANNIADGNVINASDLDGEFDAVQAAFNGTTGHSHDGTSGEGPQIDTAGIANDAVTLGTKTSGNYVATGAVSGVGLSGSASAEGATFTVTSNATNANTASTIVARDASGNFSAGTITASLTGTASNANQLDSLDSTQFLRSDTADTKSAGDLTFSDNVKAKFGGDGDLEIFHDNPNGRSVIADVGVGDLEIHATDFSVKNADRTSTYMGATNGGAVTLRYAGVTKLTTKTDGVDITGELQCDTLDVDGASDFTGNLTVNNSDIIVTGTGNRAINLTSSNAIASMEIGGSTGAFIDLKTPSSDDFDMRIQGDGGSGGSISIAGGNFNISGGGTLFNATHSGAVTLYNNGSARLATTSTGINVTGSGTNSNISVSVADDGSANAPDIFLYRNSASPAANDGIGNLTFRGNDTGANDTTYASIEGYIASPTNGSEQGRISFFLNHNNSINEEFRMESDGDFHADGDVIAFSTTISDERLKENIEKIENATDKVSQLNGYTFTYKADGKKSAGVIAQEVEKVLPSAVSEKELPLKTDDGMAYKTVQYDQIIGLLIESIKELKQEINELRGV